MDTTTSAIQVNPFQNAIDLTTTDSKHLHQRETDSLPECHKHDFNLKEIFQFVDLLESVGDELGWKLSVIDVGPSNISIFKTQGHLNLKVIKNHYDPNLANITVDDNLQFCIKSNIFFIFVKNNIEKQVIDNLKDDNVIFLSPGCGDSAALLMDIHSRNSHGTVASVVVDNSELLSLTSKNFNHNIYYLNQFF